MKERNSLKRNFFDSKYWDIFYFMCDWVFYRSKKEKIMKYDGWNFFENSKVYYYIEFNKL